MVFSFNRWGRWGPTCISGLDASSLFQALLQHSKTQSFCSCSYFLVTWLARFFFFHLKSCVEQILRCSIPTQIQQAGPEGYIHAHDLQPRRWQLVLHLLNTLALWVPRGLVREEMLRALTLYKCQLEVPDISPNMLAVSIRTRLPQHRQDASATPQPEPSLGPFSSSQEPGVGGSFSESNVFIQ